MAAATGLVLLSSVTITSAQGRAARLPAEEDLAPRSAAARAPAAAPCADCGTVWSIERRERPRWSSIVGTTSAQGAMPQPIRPRPAVRRSDDAPTDSERVAGTEAAGRPAADRDARAAPGTATETERGATTEPDLDPAAPRQPTGPAPLPERERSRVLRDPNDPVPRRGWQVTVRMDDGTTQTAYSDTQPTLRVGDRVRMGGAPRLSGSRTDPR